MKRRTVRAVTGFLCAALLLSNMTGVRAFAMEETGQGIQMQEHSLEDDTWEEEDEKAEGAEETEQADSDEEPETEAQRGDTDSDDENQEKGEKDKEGSEEEAETGSEGTTEERPKEGAEETMPEDTVEELPEEETAGTVSENTVEEVSDAEDIPASESFFPQVYSSGESFTVDGKTYKSMDADATYAAGDDITAYYFEADSLLCFDGTGPMQDWSMPVTRPWNNIKPAVCVIGEGITTVGTNAFLLADSQHKKRTPSGYPAGDQQLCVSAEQRNGYPHPAGWIREDRRTSLSGMPRPESIDIPESVTELGQDAFYECRSATSIYVPGSIKNKRYDVFRL